VKNDGYRIVDILIAGGRLFFSTHHSFLFAALFHSASLLLRKREAREEYLAIQSATWNPRELLEYNGLYQSSMVTLS
jgi:hypothetical protein